MNLVSSSKNLMARHLPSHLALFFKDRRDSTPPSAKMEKILPPWKDSQRPQVKETHSLAQTRKDNELRMITAALTRTSGKPSAAARILGISPSCSITR